MSTIAIRVDADAQIGMGHLMRCIAIAEGIGLCGGGVLFLVKENAKTVSILQQYHMDYVVLNREFAATSQRNSIEEAETVIEILNKRGIDILFVDGYNVTKEYFERMHPYVKVVYMDDLNRFHYDVDMIVNYTFGMEREQYRGYENSKVQFLLGSAYTPIRQSFVKGKKTKPGPNVRDILLTTGGTDPRNLTGGFLEQWDFNSYGEVNLHIVVGHFFCNKEILYQLQKQHSQIQLYEGATDLSELMERCDLAVSAGGTTIWELCTVGVVTIGVAFADNQAGLFELAKAGMIAGAFDFIEKEADMSMVVKEVVRLMENKPYREKVYQIARQYADGKGTIRIGEQLMKM